MNNKYAGCPACMADGRFVTSYLPRCMQELGVVDRNNQPLSSYDYRQYLQNNAEQLIQMNIAELQSRYSCGTCVGGTDLAPQTTQYCDGRTCAFSPNDPSGLGLERE